MPALKTSFLYSAYKKFLANTANFFHDKVSESFFVVGVTGTNGKSTTAHLIGHIINEKIAPCVIISSLHTTIKWKILPHEKKREDFTIFDINKLLSTAKNYGCQMAVIEISSAGLSSMAYEWVQFDAWVLTNISHDHVNTEQWFQHYTELKKDLFKKIIKNNKNNKFAVFPKDDRIWRKWFDEMPFDKKINFAIDNTAIIKAHDLQMFLNGTLFTIDYLGNSFSVKTALMWRYNVNNILSALWLVFEIGLDPEDAIDAIKHFRPLQWRMERISHDNIHYYFDISYSPNALDKTLSFLNKVKWKGRLIVVFGSPWNKNQEKRYEMGKVVARYADIMIATDSEPYHENRLQILDDLSSKISSKREWENLFIIPERKFAIQFAMEIAQENDLLLFTGRPRHGYQKTNTGKKKRDDIAFVKKILTL